jgi:multidrug efflux pump subunit AcrA (membrane-fusion protein)
MMKRLSFLMLVLLLGATVLTTACGPAAKPVAQAAGPQEKPAVPVEVATIETGDIALVFSYAGNLQSKRSVSVMPGAAGRIQSVQVKVGDEVKAGAPLMVVESDRYAVQLKQAQAALTTAKLNYAKMERGPRPEEIAAAQTAVELARAVVNDVATISDDERTAAVAALAQAEANLRQAQSEYDKISWAGQVGMTPQALRLEQATIAYQTALAAYNLQTHPGDVQLAPLEAQLAQAELRLALTLHPFTDLDFELARTGIKQAEAAVELAQLQIKETTISAPFDGVVAELYVTEGSTVGPQAPVALFVSKDVEVLVNVEEARIGQVAMNQNAALRVAAYPGQDFPAVVTSIAPVADKDTHTFAVKVTPLDEKGLLRSGMYADVSVLAQEKKGALLVPRAAVTLVNGKETVYVVKGDVVEQRTVTTGLSDNDHIEIASGVEQGEQVVIAGQADLVGGAKVEVVSGSKK